jgi:hypothetical protein
LAEGVEAGLEAGPVG